MTGKSGKGLPKNSRTGSEPKVRADFSNKLTDFLTVMMTETPSWSGIKNEDFVFGLIDALVRVSKKVPNGMGAAVLQMTVYELMERVNAELNGFNQVEAPSPPEIATLPKAGRTRLVSGIAPELVDTSEITPWDDAGTWSEESPLHSLGYNVGNGGPNAAKRRSILLKAFNSPQLPGITTNADKQKWGTAKSAQRLYALSNFVAWLARFQGSDKPAARAKWLDDLAWLEESFFRVGMQFTWPVVEMPKQAGKTVVARSPNSAFMKALKPSAALAAVVGSDALPRTEVVSKLWAYIKKHKLQDSVNTRLINADDTLMKIFGKAQVSMFEMAGLIGKHLNQPTVSNATTSKVAPKRSANSAFMKALTPSAALAAVVGSHALPRTEAISKLWQYIQKNNLQDVVDKRLINNDAVLMKIFDKPQVSMFQMAGLVGKHLS